MKDKKKGNFTKKIRTACKNVVEKVKKIKINRKVVYIILGLLVLFFFIKLISPKEVNYPVIFNDSDGDLYLVTTKVRSKDDAVKLATTETASKVKYANNTARYVLFQKEENLYLYDAKKKDETRKILNNIAGTNYYFSDDDKYIIALDEANNLKVSNYKEAKKIAGNVTNIIAIKGDYIIFEKENEIHVRHIKPSKDDEKKVTEKNSYNVMFSEDAKYVMYITNTNELHKYNIKKSKDEKIANSVTSYYCDEDSCDDVYYIQEDGGKNIIFNNGKKAVKVAEDIFAVLATNIDDEQIVYSKANGNKFELYYQKGAKKAARIDEGLSGLKTVKLLGKDIYYVTSENKLKYGKISGAKISRRLTVSSDVFGYLYEYEKGFAYVTKVDDYYNGTLNIAKGGKAKKISENVGSSTIKVNKDGDRIYYIKDFGKDGELYYTKGGKGKLVDTKVHVYEYVKDDLLYLVKDYSSSKARGDLYRYTNKSIKIADNISRIASSPVVYEGK